ncbi:MAG TPA: tryptophan synthase subunit alpha, partial [Solirubrobacterales bacterium]|nr:tryptophan synthase subunit alpha [Solirubrobacterales bacterium]
MTRRSTSMAAPSSHPPDSSLGSSGEERIAAAFDAARAEQRAALMPYMMAGYPDRESSLAVANAYVDAGADLIELG